MSTLPKENTTYPKEETTVESHQIKTSQCFPVARVINETTQSTLAASEMSQILLGTHEKMNDEVSVYTTSSNCCSHLSMKSNGDIKLPISASTPISTPTVWSDLPSLHPRRPDDPVYGVPTPPPSESPKSTTSSKGSSFNLPFGHTHLNITATSDDTIHTGLLFDGETPGKELPKVQSHFSMPANIIGEN